MRRRCGVLAHQTDLVVAVRDQGYMFVTGPDVIRDVTGEEVSLDELGGADHQACYGSIHQVVDSENAAAFQYVRDFLGSCRPTPFDDAPVISGPPNRRSRRTISNSTASFPDADNTAYDMREILIRIFDDGDFLDVAAQAGQGHHRLRPRRRPAEGWWQNQPMHMSAPSTAGLRQGGPVRPVLRLLQRALVSWSTPRLPARCVEREKNGIIKRGGRFLYAVVEPTS